MYIYNKYKKGKPEAGTVQAHFLGKRPGKKPVNEESN